MPKRMEWPIFIPVRKPGESGPFDYEKVVYTSIQEATGAMLKASPRCTDDADYRDDLRAVYREFRARGGRDLDLVGEVLFAASG